jgi:hypothetical protein
LRGPSHRQKSVRHHPNLAGHVSCVPLSAWPRAVARDGSDGPGSLGSQGESPECAGVRVARRSDPRICGVLYDRFQRRRAYHPRARGSVYGGRVAVLPDGRCEPERRNHNLRCA